MPFSDYKSSPFLPYRSTSTSTGTAAAGIATILGAVVNLWAKFKQEQEIDNAATGDEVRKVNGSKRLHPREWWHDTELCIRL